VDFVFGGTYQETDGLSTFGFDGVNAVIDITDPNFRALPIPVNTVILLGLVGIAMLFIIVLMIAPKDLSSIKGYPVSTLDSKEPRNLLQAGQKTLIDRKSSLTIGEEEANKYLNHRVKGSQKGLFGGMMKFKGVYVDLEPGTAEVFVERSFLGIRNTTSVVVKNDYNKAKRESVWRIVGGGAGRFGIGKLVPQPITALFGRLVTLCEEERKVLEYMTDVTFEKDKLTLHPTKGRK
ncbi:MAG: hypothetical protein AAF226_12970, partial [Verrucomicrobiota bacterium]